MKHSDRSFIQETQILELDISPIRLPEHNLLWHILFRAYLDFFSFQREKQAVEEKLKNEPGSSKRRGQLNRRIKELQGKIGSLKAWFASDEADQYGQFAWICEVIAEDEGQGLKEGFRKALTGTKARALSLYFFDKKKNIDSPIE